MFDLKSKGRYSLNFGLDNKLLYISQYTVQDQITVVLAISTCSQSSQRSLNPVYYLWLSIEIQLLYRTLQCSVSLTRLLAEEICIIGTSSESYYSIDSTFLERFVYLLSVSIFCQYKNSATADNKLWYCTCSLSGSLFLSKRATTQQCLKLYSMYQITRVKE